MTELDEYTAGANGHMPPVAGPPPVVGQLDRLDEIGPVELGERGALVPWGDKAHQRVSPVIAAAMLRLLRERDARLWAELHYEAATGEPIDLSEPAPARRRRKPAGD